MTSGWIVQISDLHIGSNIGGGGMMPGQTAHDYGALEALDASLQMICRDRPGPKGLIVSGDVSARGTQSELNLYRTLVDSGVPRKYGTLGPLRRGFAWVLDIPGNHDYWNGNMANPLNRHCRAVFPAVPWIKRLNVGQDIVAFHGLCSTSGATTGWFSQQFWAVGAFEPTDVRDVEASIASVPPPTAGKLYHVLVTHHSPAAGTPSQRGITGQGLTDLNRLCSNRGLRALLTGHDHSYTIAPPGQHLNVVEVRCSTTTQANAVTLLRQERSFLLHEFREEGRWWDAQLVPDTLDL